MTTTIRRLEGIGCAVALVLVIGGGPSQAPAPFPQLSADASSVPCAATPIQTRPFPGPLGGLRWIVARPVSAGITGHLFYGQTAHGPAAALHIHGTMPDGGTTKILWVIRTGAVGPVLEIIGHTRTGAGRTHQAFPAASGGGVAGTPYPSIIDVPTPGCWQFRLQSGQVKGTVTMRVVR
jgi:hypothetical protein